MNMLKGIIDEEQYIRITENLKQEIFNNKLSIDTVSYTHLTLPTTERV